MLKSYLPESTMQIVYRSLSESVINYGLTSFGFASDYKIEKIQKLQDKCVKTTVGKNPSNLSLEQIYENLGILKVKSLLKYNVVKKYHFNGKFRMKIENSYLTRLQKTEQYHVPPWSNKYGKRTLDYVIPELYNSLPAKL